MHGRCRPPRLTPPVAALELAARRPGGSHPAALRGKGRHGTAGPRGSRGVARNGAGPRAAPGASIARISLSTQSRRALSAGRSREPEERVTWAGARPRPAQPRFLLYLRVFRSRCPADGAQSSERPTAVPRQHYRSPASRAGTLRPRGVRAAQRGSVQNGVTDPEKRRWPRGASRPASASGGKRARAGNFTSGVGGGTRAANAVANASGGDVRCTVGSTASAATGTSFFSRCCVWRRGGAPRRSGADVCAQRRPVQLHRPAAGDTRRSRTLLPQEHRRPALKPRFGHVTVSGALSAAARALISKFGARSTVNGEGCKRRCRSKSSSTFELKSVFSSLRVTYPRENNPRSSKRVQNARTD